MFNSEAVKKRLESFGYRAEKEDEFSLDFCAMKTKRTILNQINWKELPEELEYIAVDMAAGEFLTAKKTFAIGSGSLTKEQRLDLFINHLLSYGKGEINSFRRLRW